MIVISGTSSIGKRAVQGMMDHAGELRLHGPCLDLQRIDGRAVNFVREFEFAPRRRPAGDHEQNGGDHEIDTAKDGGGDIALQICTSAK